MHCKMCQRLAGAPVSAGTGFLQDDFPLSKRHPTIDQFSVDVQTTKMSKLALDAADVRILCALQTYGRLSKAKLAEKVNLSPTPCWTRLTRLEKAGLIRGYHADIALDRIADVSRVVVTVSLGQHRKSDFERFERHIEEREEIVECVATGGGMDYVMTVVTPGLTAFQDLMEELMASDLKVDRYMTYIATREVKSVRPSLARLLDDPRR